MNKILYYNNDLQQKVKHANFGLKKQFVHDSTAFIFKPLKWKVKKKPKYFILDIFREGVYK